MIDKINAYLVTVWDVACGPRISLEKSIPVVLAIYTYLSKHYKI